MKHMFCIAALVVSLSACSDSAQELRKKCNGILGNSDLKEYYDAEYVEKWRNEVESCGNDPECLTICYEMLAGKLAVAQEELPHTRSGIQ